jgi:positive regulator of sigma E activity
MFKLYAELNPVAFKVLMVIAITIFFGFEIVYQMGVGQGLKIDRSEYDAVFAYLVPLGAMALGVVFSQYLPIWKRSEK